MAQLTTLQHTPPTCHTTYQQLAHLQASSRWLHRRSIKLAPKMHGQRKLNLASDEVRPPSNPNRLVRGRCRTCACVQALMLRQMRMKLEVQIARERVYEMYGTDPLRRCSRPAMRWEREAAIVGAYAPRALAIDGREYW